MKKSTLRKVIKEEIKRLTEANPTAKSFQKEMQHQEGRAGKKLLNDSIKKLESILNKYDRRNKCWTTIKYSKKLESYILTALMLLPEDEGYTKNLEAKIIKDLKQHKYLAYSPGEKYENEDRILFYVLPII